MKAINPSNFTIPGYLVMFVFFTAAFSAAQLVENDKTIHWSGYYPVWPTKTEILGGVYAGTVAKGLIQIAIFWTVGILGFKMNLGVARRLR